MQALVVLPIYVTSLQIVHLGHIYPPNIFLLQGYAAPTKALLKLLQFVRVKLRLYQTRQRHAP